MVSRTHHVFLPRTAFAERLVSESNGKETGLFSQFVGKYLSKYDDIRYYTLKSLRYSTPYYSVHYHVILSLLYASMLTAVYSSILCEQKKSAADQSPTNDTVLAMYLLLQKVTMPESDQHITSFWIPVQTKSLKALSAPAAKPKKKNKKSKVRGAPPRRHTTTIGGGGNQTASNPKLLAAQRVRAHGAEEAEEAHPDQDRQQEVRRQPGRQVRHRPQEDIRGLLARLPRSPPHHPHLQGSHRRRPPPLFPPATS